MIWSIMDHKMALILDQLKKRCHRRFFRMYQMHPYRSHCAWQVMVFDVVDQL